MLNETHNQARTSWVESANEVDCDFPIQNLPFASYSTPEDAVVRIGVAIGDRVLDLKKIGSLALLDGLAAEALAACRAEHLNGLMALGQAHWSALRLGLSNLLASGSEHADTVAKCLDDQADAIYAVPAQIGDYTDFYTSIHHATNIGKLFRPDNPLLPNYQWVPIGYHGRSSSIGVSGESFHRPVGQIKLPDADSPQLMPCKRLDYELEVGILIGTGNEQGTRIDLDTAEDHVFGLCLLNDWSARDIQAWEYQPLGPFLSKSFASTVSPWVVTMEALAPYRKPWSRVETDPQPLSYLESTRNRSTGNVDMDLEVFILTQRMRDSGEFAFRLSKSNFTDAYWTIAQLVAHHTVNGCNLVPGDLFGSGTMSGQEKGSEGALIEITKGGAEPITLPNGETRTFLEDGDTVILRASAEREGYVRIGFGEASGTVLPAK